MRGISFIRNKCDDSIFATILDGVDVKRLYWNVSEDEVYLSNDDNLFIEKFIDGSTFFSLININYYMSIFANIKAYTDNNYSDNINCYDDFLKSNCELVILCSDSAYFEIYSKSTSIIEIIKSNCIKKGFDEIEYITDENDCRTIFSVG
ncbi:DUF2691 family protein [Clostridium sp. UBA1056]|uniref:DUF2691 family protein n=1 Tax=unclassified Clostridium TaxID=2614128 RepID=UPI00321744DF